MMETFLSVERRNWRDYLESCLKIVYEDAQKFNGLAMSQKLCSKDRKFLMTFSLEQILATADDAGGLFVDLDLQGTDSNKHVNLVFWCLRSWT